MKSNLHLLPLTNTVAASEVLAASETGRLFACDFGVVGAEHFEAVSWGYEKGRLTNIDHHAPTPRMRERISSTNLALRYVSANGIAGAQDSIIINHTDCDSILSSAIVLGDLEPREEFGVAAIAADHTGEENAIADLLQALDKQRDYEYSMRNLRSLLEGRQLDDEAQAALNVRHAKRAKAAELVEEGAFTVQNGVAWAELGDAIDGEFFPALLPDAVLIAMFSPREGEEGKWDAKFRLGQAAPPEFSLPDVLAPIDAGYGGRWNAGSNKRAGGSKLSPEQYVAAIAKRV